MDRSRLPADAAASTAPTLAWLALLALTLATLALGHWLHGVPWLALPVAAIIWLKGWLVARHFIESHLAHPFIARLLQFFVAFVPLALLLTVFFGEWIARWASLR